MNPVVQALITQANEVILGKQRQIQLALACLFARGHLLIEDLPGMGKTTLAHLLATLMGLQFNRIQFTSDLLPSDIIGAAIYHQDSGSFSFHRGPIFTQLVLADEINRASPKAQSALLEAMEERQVSAEGETMALPEPFFVIATQNPTHHIGTFALPESQYDRFMMRIQLGYPSRQAERGILTGRDRNVLLQTMPACLTPEQVIEIQAQVPQVHVSEPLLDYLQDLVDFSRSEQSEGQGLSPRGSQALLHCAQAWAFIEGRNAVIPEDIQAVLPSVVGHRLGHSQNNDPHHRVDPIQQLLQSVAIP